MKQATLGSLTSNTIIGPEFSRRDGLHAQFSNNFLISVSTDLFYQENRCKAGSAAGQGRLSILQIAGYGLFWAKIFLTCLCCIFLSNARAQFTVNSISVSSTQTGTLTYGAGASVSYTITLGMVAGSNNTTNFNLNWTPPAGVTYLPLSTSLTGNGQTLTLTLTSTAATPAGIYAFTVTSNDGSGNITSGSASFIVDPKPLTITAGDQGKTYGTMLNLGSTTFNAPGLVNGDVVSSVTLSSTGSVNTANTGTYPIIPSAANGTGLSNYAITYANGNLTVDPATLTITANDVSKPYGAAISGGAGSTAFTHSALQNGETIGTVTIAYGTGASAGAPAGNYPGAVVPSSAIGGTFNPANYTIAYIAGDITVTNTNTSIVVTSNINPACTGTNVSFLATITSVLSNATGTVEFFDGGTSLGTVTVASNQASKLISTLPVGIRNITVVYSGDANNNSSASAILSQEIKAIPTTAAAGANQSACGVSSVILAANTPAAGTGKWTVATGSGGSFVDDQNPGTAFNGVIGNSYTLRWTVSNNPCIASTNDVLVTLNTTPIVNPPASPFYCNNGTSSVINFTGTGTSYTWTNSQPSIGLAATGTGSIPAFTVSNTGTANIVANLTVTPSANGCTGSAANFTITAKPQPVVTATPSTQTICSGSNITAISLTSNIGGTINWSRDNVAGITGGGGLAVFSASNVSSITGSFASTLAAPGTVGIHATATFNGCSSASLTDFSVTVNPVATVNSISSQTVCHNTNTTAINFVSPNATSFTWTNTNTAIGLSASGNTNIAAFTGTNGGTSPISGLITVTPVYTNVVNCNGTAGNFTITVNPVAALTSSPSPAAICSGTVFNYTPTSDATGVTLAYNWTRPAISTINSNTGASGTANISEVLTSTATSLVNVIYNYTITATNNSISCVNPTTFSVTVPVNPSPKVKISPSGNQNNICTGSAMNPVDILSNSTVGISSFGWYRLNNTTAISGIASSGTGTTISGTLTSSASNSRTTNFKAYGISASGCYSDTVSTTFTVTVHPAITNNTILVSHVSQVSICGLTQQLTIATPAPLGGSGSYTYQWQESSDNVTFTNISGATGSTLVKSIASFTDYYFQRIAYSGGCQNTSNSYHVSPATGDRSYLVGECGSGSGFDITVFASYLGATYTLQRSTDGGATWANYTANSTVPLTGNGSTLTFASKTQAGIFRVEADIGTSCKELVSGTFTLDPTILPSASALTTSASVTTACSGTTVNLFANDPSAPAGSAPAVSWYYTASGATEITGVAVPLGSPFPMVMAVPANGIDSVITFYAKYIYSATGCKSTTKASLPINVNKTPLMTSSDSVATCSGSAVNIPLTNDVPRASTYTWIAIDNVNTTGESLTLQNTSTLNNTINNTVGTPQTVLYTVTPTVTSTGCVGNSQTVKVVVDPKPVIGPQATTVCSGSSFTISPTNGGGNSVPTSPVTQYTWSAPTGAGFSGGTAGSGTSITGSLVNNTSFAVTAFYDVTPSGGVCTGSPFTATVTVNPKPSITNQAVDVCNGSFSIPPFTGSNIVPANTTYSWPVPTGSNISGLAASPASPLPTTVFGTLVNTSSPVVTKTATYTVTPTGPAALGGCVGNSFTVAASVKPIPAAVISGTTTVCPGTATNIIFTGSNGTPSYAFTYQINGAGSYTASTAAGNSTVTIPANTASPGTVTYSLVSVSDALNTTCQVIVGGLATVTITQPPVIPSGQTLRACSGVLSSFTAVDGSPTPATIVPAGTTYSWSVPGSLPAGVSGASPGTAQPDFSQTLINNTSLVQNVTYMVTPSNNGCAGTPFSIIVSVDPALASNTAIWTGSNNTDWCNSWNWACGNVPNSFSVDAIIPPGTPNQPSIFGTCNATVRNLDLQGTATLNLDAGRGLTVYGEFITTTNPSRYTLNGVVTFAGGNQQIPGFTYTGLSVTGGGIKTLTGPATVNGNLSLVNGVIVTSNTNMLTAGLSANVSNGSDQSYIQGPLTRQTNSTATYTFPVGSNGNVRNAYVVPTTNAISSYTVYYHNSVPTINSVLDANLAGVQINEYWDVIKNSGVDAIIGMDYVNPNGLADGAATTDWSSGINPCWNCNVAVAYGDALNNWYFTGGMGGGFGANEATYWQSNNTVFSRLQSTYGQFSFGYAYAVILPVKLLQFTGKLQGNVSQLDWKYTNGTEVASTELQHSVDGNHFVKLSVFAGGDDDYKYYHSNLKGGPHYYRLMIKDKAGKITYSNTVLLIVGSDITVIKGIRPTMVHNEAYIAIHSVKSQAVQAILFDLAGRKVAEYRGNLVEGENNFRIDAMKLAKGFYTAHVVTNDGAQANLRFIKE